MRNDGGRKDGKYSEFAWNRGDVLLSLMMSPSCIKSIPVPITPVQVLARYSLLYLYTVYISLMVLQTKKLKANCGQQLAAHPLIGRPSPNNLVGGNRFCTRWLQN
jgi:hypothetical protein